MVGASRFLTGRTGFSCSKLATTESVIADYPGPVYAVSFYTVAAGQFDRVREVYPRHRAYLDEFAKSGQIIMIGTFADPISDGSMAIFRSRAAAEAFRDADPFVLERLVGESRILDWDPLEFSAGQTEE